MKLFLLVIAGAVAVGLLLGGRLSRLERVRLHWWGLAIAGLGIQFVPLPEGSGGIDLLIRTLVLVVSYATLLAFVVVNLRVAGMPLLLTGIALNAVVIVVNGGMPVGAETLRASGQEQVLEALRIERADKHHLLDDGDRLTFLADVIAVPQPIGQAISIGDVFIYAGLIWAIVGIMRGQTPPPDSQTWGPYRGRHRPGEAPPPRDDLGFHPATTKSETER